MHWTLPLAALAVPALLHSTVHAQDSLTVRTWLLENHASLGLTARDAAEWRVTQAMRDAKGVGHVYIRQQAHGMPVMGAVANFAIRDGRVVHVGNRLQPDVHGRAPQAPPALAPDQALRHAAQHLALPLDQVQVLEQRAADEVVLSAAIARTPITARSVLHVSRDGRIVRAWELDIRSANTANWWQVAVDAHTGEVVKMMDYLTECQIAPGTFSHPYNALDDLALAPQPRGAGGGGGGGGGAAYRVYPFPTESPAHGAHTLVTAPADPVASPFGWHDINGIPGAEFTITRGNNVYAGEDLDNDDFIGYSPNGGPGLVFDFPHNLASHPHANMDASITNLFYTCNVLHDVWYRYGFDEASGNFQRYNYTGMGNPSDEVIAQALDGGGMNNANFGTPPDGSNGYMQMYLWRVNEDSTLYVNAPTAIEGYYSSSTGGFGPPLPTTPLTADLVMAQDNTPPTTDACEQLVNAAAIAGHIALVDRGLCTFVDKVLTLQSAGALAVIVINNVPGGAIQMGGTDDGLISIPSMMISQADGQILRNALANGPVNVTIVSSGENDLRDSSFDNGIVAHEYGHGVSIRLTGGASDSWCLIYEEQMGEGWSDWMGLILSIRPGDTPNTVRGVATFSTGEPNHGNGIRPAPYTKDMSINPYTYGDTNDPALSQPHGVGFVWATMLWDLAWDLIDVYGYDPDPYTGTGGNNMAIQLMMDGLKLQPCAPGFVDGRNAILMADSLNYDGVNSCLIWHAFARRGLGYSADQGSSDSRFDQVEAFDLPPACIGISAPAIPVDPTFSLAPNPADDQVTLRWPGAPTGPVHMRMIAADGRTVRTMDLAMAGGRAEFGVAGLAPGVYVVELSTAGHRAQQRLVVR